jgi:hypothetical protein
MLSRLRGKRSLGAGPANCLDVEAFVGLEVERLCQAQHGVDLRLAQSSLQVPNRACTEA